MFGDYALDTSPIQKPQRRTPSAHLRYSTPSSYVVSKGHSVKKPRGYGAIYPVAEALVARDAYAGPNFSLGDLFINELATRTVGPGNAASWRWAATDHHITANFRAINSFFGIEERAIAKPPEQFALFKEMESPSTAPTNPADEVARTNVDVPPDDEDLPRGTG